MTPAAATTLRTHAVAAAEAGDAAYRLLGLAIIALIPALFWTGVLALAAQPGALTLAATGATIAAFILATVSRLQARIS